MQTIKTRYVVISAVLFICSLIATGVAVQKSGFLDDARNYISSLGANQSGETSKQEETYYQEYQEHPMVKAFMLALAVIALYGVLREAFPVQIAFPDRIAWKSPSRRSQKVRANNAKKRLDKNKPTTKNTQ